MAASNSLSQHCFATPLEFSEIGVCPAQHSRPNLAEQSKHSMSRTTAQLPDQSSGDIADVSLYFSQRSISKHMHGHGIMHFIEEKPGPDGMTR